MKPAALLALLTLAACTSVPFPEADPSLREAADFPVGAALSPTRLRSHAPYQQTVVQHFNSLTAENVMKMHHLQPRQGEFAWADADYLIAFAQQNGMRVHGHTLLWHDAVPEWAKGFEGTPAEWEALVKDHVQTVAAHFKGQVAGWDVVNEALNDDGTLRASIWREHLGDDYVARIFQWAHEADPDALLFYNDYGLEQNGPKLQAALALADGLRARGIRIDGIGLQMHVQIGSPRIDQIEAAAQAAAAKGYLVHFSELDVRANDWGTQDPKYKAYTPRLAAMQRNGVRSIIRAYRTLPASAQYGITTWGVGDADSWIRSYVKMTDWPLLFDEQYRPKESFHGFLDALSE